MLRSFPADWKQGSFPSSLSIVSYRPRLMIKAGKASLTRRFYSTQPGQKKNVTATTADPCPCSTSDSLRNQKSSPIYMHGQRSHAQYNYTCKSGQTHSKVFQTTKRWIVEQKGGGWARWAKPPTPIKSVVLQVPTDRKLGDHETEHLDLCECSTNLTYTRHPLSHCHEVSVLGHSKGLSEEFFQKALASSSDSSLRHQIA